MSECQICVAETESDYCLKCMAKAVVKWIPGWEWNDEIKPFNTPKVLYDRVRADGEIIPWERLKEDRNLWHAVEEEMIERNVSHSYAVELCNQGLGSPDRQQEWVNFRTADPKTCLKAFARTRPIQQVLEEMEDER